MHDFKRDIQLYFEQEIEVLKRLDLDEINTAINVILDTYNQEATIYIFGNGGSAATASHFENDFNKGISEYSDKKFRFRCLNDNVPTLMAIANDIGYEDVFEFQLRGRLQPDDLVIGISGSGNSKNVIKAVEYAKEIDAKVIGITGFSGGKLKQLSDYYMHVPIDDMQIVEDIHMIFDHMMMRVIRRLIL